MKNYLQLEKEILKISHLNNLISLIYWDMAAKMPLGSAESRTNEITTLSSIAHSMLKSSKISDLVTAALEETKSLDQWQLANVREINKTVQDASCIEDDLQARFVSSSAECEFVWRNAKKNNDYPTFKPHLQKVLNCVHEISEARASKFSCSKYDALIDQYDPDRKSHEIRQIFSVIKQHIPSLIQEIVEKQKLDTAVLESNKIDIATQKKIGKRIMEIMGFDFSKGRLDESAHPFCGGTPDDIRLTTKYDENNFLSGLFATMHETGHALYEQNLPPLYKHQPVGSAKGMAVHESQSLFMEMQVGTSREFTEFLSKLLKDEFNFKRNEYNPDNLYKSLNRVKPDFIRIDADEVTYPMHVILRFEIEEMLINKDLTLDELPAYWDKKMQEYLGITPPSISQGCMQDIHWSMGNFGYFPAYTNGAIIASMLMKKVNEQGHALEDIREGKFESINRFLNSNLRSFGSLKKTQELIKDATGEDQINPNIFINYLKKKYLDQ